MIDITEVDADGALQTQDTQAWKAKNILSVQLAALEYAPTLGIDLQYFLQDAIKFQNESFQSYLVQVLANNGINVATIETTLNDLFVNYDFNLAREETSTALLAR